MELDFDKLDGLVPAVVQDRTDGRVLMVGFMNEEAFRKTVETGCVTFYSRSRNELWTKGETSGHTIQAMEIQTDCDRDTVLILAEVQGPGVCHDGYRSCFYQTLQDGVWIVNARRTFDPGAVYGGGSK